MIFLTKISSKLYWSFFLKIKLIKNIYISKMKFILKFILIFKIDMFYFNQFLHNISNSILIRFKGITVNYLYVY